MKILSKFIVLSVFLLAVDSASAQTRETRCPKLIGKLSDGTYVPAKANHMCFSSVKEAKKKGFIAESSSANRSSTGDSFTKKGFSRLMEAQFKISTAGTYSVSVARGGQDCSLLGLSYKVGRNEASIFQSKSSRLEAGSWFSSMEVELIPGDHLLDSKLDKTIEVEFALPKCEWFVTVTKKN